MSRIKSIIIYGVLALLVVAAVVTTGISKNSNKAAQEVSTKTTAVASTTAEVSRAATATTENSTVAEATKQVEQVSTDEQTRINDIMKKSSEILNQSPIVGIGKGKDYAKATQTAVKNAGGLEGIVKKGDTVLLKPNVCVMVGPDDPRITDYRVVQELADEVKKLGAARVIVAEGSFSGYTLETAQYNKIPGVELLDFNEVKKENCYALKPLKSLTGEKLFIPKIYMQADVVISVAKLKTHAINDAVVSLSLKNAFGVPPMPLTGLSYKESLHTFGMIESIIDLNRIRRPDFVVIDGIIGGEGIGPSENIPVDSQIIFAGADPVATDVLAAHFMGFELEDVPHLQRAVEEKLGIGDLKKIKAVGASNVKYERAFSRY